MNASLRRCAVAAVALTLTFVPAPALADEASTHFQRGVELYSEADYRAALLEFKRAYELEPRYQVLYNIATSEYQLLDYAGALQAFEKYLAQGGVAIPAPRRAEVEREVGRLRARVARVKITSNVEGAQVAVDDVAVGTTPLAQPVVVSAGRRKITVVAPGRPPSSVQVDLVGGDSKNVAVDLAAAEAPPGPGPAPPAAGPPQDTEPPPRSVPWVGWIATGALAAGTAVTGVLAISSSNDLKTKLHTFGTSQDAIDSAHSKTATLGIVTDVLLGATAVAAGVSLYFTLRTPSAPNATGAARAGQVGVVVAPRGARVEVTF